MLSDKEAGIKKYPLFLQKYYFSAKEDREGKIKNFYSDVQANSIILEGACGKVSIMRDSNPNIKILIGVDLSKDSIKLNDKLDFKIVSDLENLPFKKDYFDIVNLVNVIEHLKNPEKVFREANYVLKKGGVLLISTKNIYNPFMASNKFLPFNIRYLIKKKFLKITGHYLDTFPAPYRCNSPRRMNKVLVNCGFKIVNIWLWGWPLIGTNMIGLFFSMLYEKLTDRRCLQLFKPNIWVKVKKVKDNICFPG